MKKPLTKDDILIMVAYINVGNDPIQEVSKNMTKISTLLQLKGNPFERWYVFPVRNQETKVECLNPALLSEDKYEKVKKQFDLNEEKINNILKSFNINNKNKEIKNCMFCGESGCHGECLTYKESEK